MADHAADETQLLELCILLASLVEILDQEADEHWSRWMRTARDSVARGELEGVDHFLGAFGGMGSFNDVGSERSLEVAAKAYAVAKQIQSRHATP